MSPLFAIFSEYHMCSKGVEGVEVQYAEWSRDWMGGALEPASGAKMRSTPQTTTEHGLFDASGKYASYVALPLRPG